MTDQELIDEVMDWFDFERVHKVMTVLDWKWSDGESVPTMPELRKRARDLMKDAIRELDNNHKEKEFTIATAGFQATAFLVKDDVRILDLKFVVSEWTAGPAGLY